MRRTNQGFDALFFNELPNRSKEVRAVHVAFSVDRDSFGHARARGVRVRTRIRNEVFDRAVLRASDPNASLDTGIETVAGLRQPELSGVGAPIPGLGVGNV